MQISAETKYNLVYNSMGFMTTALNIVRRWDSSNKFALSYWLIITSQKSLLSGHTKVCHAVKSIKKSLIFVVKKWKNAKTTTKASQRLVKPKPTCQTWRQSRKSGPNFLSDLQSTIISKPMNLFSLLHKSKIHMLF